MTTASPRPLPPSVTRGPRPARRSRAPDELPTPRAALAVCAHPDDESFGLGAALSYLSSQGSAVSVLCFTHGEASRLGTCEAHHLAAVRRAELAEAAEVLGVKAVRLLDYPDGTLLGQARHQLAAEVETVARATQAELLIAFDEGGVTGHPDHIAATGAAMVAAASLKLPVLAWAIESKVADSLNRVFGTCFSGREPAELDIRTNVDRERQWLAIECHRSQAIDNPVLRQRLESQRGCEVFRWLRPPNTSGPSPRQARPNAYRTEKEEP
jgi:N-acetylglucosamine malate deacetylase 2